MNRMTWQPSRLVTMAAAVCGLVLGTMGLLPLPAIDIRWRVPGTEPEAFVSSARQDAGDELLLVVIGSSTCRWSNSDEFVDLVAEVRAATRQVADQRGAALAIMGVSQDERPEDGVKYLRRFGGLDEMAVGRGWQNTAIGKYIFSDFPGRAATPQVLVIARTLTREGGQWGVENERVLARKIGLWETRPKISEYGPGGRFWLCGVAFAARLPLGKRLEGALRAGRCLFPVAGTLVRRGVLVPGDTGPRSGTTFATRRRGRGGVTGSRSARSCSRC